MCPPNIRKRSAEAVQSGMDRRCLKGIAVTPYAECLGMAVAHNMQ